MNSKKLKNSVLSKYVHKFLLIFTDIYNITCSIYRWKIYRPYKNSIKPLNKT